MAALTDARVRELLKPYLDGSSLSPEMLANLSRFLDLLIYWNARTNLSSIRDPEQIMQRQVGESLFCAQLIPHGNTVLDFGSGAGFPGIPLQLLRADLQVTLAESQGKKVAFLREAVRTLHLSCSVWPGRVEDLESQGFDTVTMRAVDRTDSMLPVATKQVTSDGSLIRFVSGKEVASISGWAVDMDLPVPLTQGRIVRLMQS